MESPKKRLKSKSKVQNVGENVLQYHGTEKKQSLHPIWACCTLFLALLSSSSFQNGAIGKAIAGLTLHMFYLWIKQKQHQDSKMWSKRCRHKPPQIENRTCPHSIIHSSNKGHIRIYCNHSAFKRPIIKPDFEMILIYLEFSLLVSISCFRK